MSAGLTRAEIARLWRESHPEYVRAYNEARRTPPSELKCVECDERFYGRKDRLTCSRKCKDARYRRLHPEEWREQRRRHDARVRARRRGKA